MKPASLLSLVLALSASAVARAERYDIYILAGQSNMDGRAKADDLKGDLAKYRDPQKDVQIDYGNPVLKGEASHTDGFVPLGPGFSIAPGRAAGGTTRHIPTETFGPEVSFGRAMADAGAGKHVRLIKFAQGGTSLKKDWNPDAKGKLHDGLVEHVSKALQLMRDRGDTYEIKGFVWHQGESDSKLSADEYRDRLTAFVKQVRADFGTPELPVVLGECYDNGERKTIRQAQIEVSGKVPNVYFATSAGLHTLDKDTHFDAPGQIALGLRMAKALIEQKSVANP